MCLFNCKKDEEFDIEVVLEKAGFVKCEHTKLWGKKEDMVEKTIVRDTYHRYIGVYPTSEIVYYSPAFAPEWEIKDMTDIVTRYTKTVKTPDKVVEVKIKS